MGIGLPKGMTRDEAYIQGMADAEVDRIAALACGEPDAKPCTVPNCPWCHANPTNVAGVKGPFLSHDNEINVTWNDGYAHGYKEGRLAAIRVIVRELFFPDNGINAALKELTKQIEERR